MATNNELLLSQKYNNYNYAPGIATYGIDGKTGEPGYDGNNIYFTDYDIINGQFMEVYRKIQENLLPLVGLNIKVSRPYKEGDLFFDKNGVIFEYRLNPKHTEDDYTEYFKIVGKLNAVGDSSLFKLCSNNRLILSPTEYKGFDIISGVDSNDAELFINTETTMNIVSNVINENDNIEMIRLQSVDEVDVEDGQLTLSYKTTDNAYYVDSNKPVVINSDLKLNNDNNVDNEYDDYSTVLTSNDTITYFKYLCDKLSYNIIYDTDVNKYKLVIYSTEEEEDDLRRTLNYIINRNETVYGKIYTGENDEVLIPLTTIIDTSIAGENYYDYMPDYKLKINNIGGVLHLFELNYKLNNIQHDITVNTINMICNKSDINGIVNIDAILNLTDYDLGPDIDYFDASLLNSVVNNNLWAVGIYLNANKYESNLINIYGDQDEPNSDATYNITVDSSTRVAYNGAVYTKANIISKNLFKYNFDTINTNNTLTLSIYPLTRIYSNISRIFDYVYFKELAPILIEIQILDDINDACTLYFTLNYSEEKFSINNMMLFKRNDLLNIETSIRPCILAYIPDNINSILKFSLIHNTEIFLNYQNNIEE